MVDVYEEEDQAIIKISDTGIGIPKEDIPIYLIVSSGLIKPDPGIPEERDWPVHYA